MIRRLAVPLLLAALIGGCQPPVGPDPASPDPATPCRQRAGLPDPSCTPGAINPAVRQDNLHETVCRPGFSQTQRPPAAFTNALKRRQLASYGPHGALADFEEDHLIPLSLGGAPSDPRNLWPEPRAGPPGTVAPDKDRVELVLFQRLCSGQIALAAAQHAIASDWRTAGGRRP